MKKDKGKGKIVASVQQNSSLDKLKEKAEKEGAILLGNEDSDKPESPDRIPLIEPSNVWNLATNMREDMNKRKMSESQAKERHQELSTDFPRIFDMVYKGSSLEMLKMMLEKIESIKKGNSTYEEESITIGKIAFDKYIKK